MTPCRSTTASGHSSAIVRSRTFWVCRSLLIPMSATCSTCSAYSWHALITNYLVVGDPLSETQCEVEKGLAFVKKAGFGLVEENCAAQLGLIRTLRGLTAAFGSFDADDYSETETEHRLAN